MKNFKFKINGHDYSVDIKEADGQEMKVSVNGVDYEVTVDREVRKHASTMVAERPSPHVAVPSSGVVQRYNATEASNNPSVPKPSHAPMAPASGTSVTAPLPGTILDVMVNVGDAIKEGESVVLLEAMKMENHIEAPVSGTISEIRVRKGDSVLENDILVVIA